MYRYIKKKKNYVHNKILESLLYRDGLHLGSNGTTMLARNFISKIQCLLCDVNFSRGKLL